jgi:hypothetical protein
MDPFWKRLAIFLVACLAIGAGWYGVTAYLYWNNPPKIARNFSAEQNATILATSESERAWPVYREVLIGMGPAPAEFYRGYGPWVDADTPVVASFVRRNQGALEKVRNASQRSILGYSLSDGEPYEDYRVRTRHLPPGAAEPRPPTSNPLLWCSMMTPLLEVGVLSQSLASDAILSAGESDGERMTADLLAMMRLADHIGENPGPLVTSFAAMYFAEALRTWGHLMTAAPNMFDEPRLQALEAAARGFAGGKIEVRFDFARVAFHDVMQRVYTDDGNGNGYFYLPGFLELQPLFPFIEAPLKAIAVTAPLTKERYYSRKESVAEFERLLQLAAADTARPIWKCVDWPHAQARDRLQADPRWRIVHLLTESYDDDHAHLERVVQQRDAVLAASAILRFQRRHGAWPTTLKRLIPEFLGSLPVDRCDGQSLLYRVTPAGPLLYSVGTDGDDDGGRAPLIKVPDYDYSNPSYPPKYVQWPCHWLSVSSGENLEGDVILWPVASAEELAYRPSPPASP